MVIGLDQNGQLLHASEIAVAGIGDGPIIGSDGNDYLVLYLTAVGGKIAQRVMGDGTVGTSTTITQSVPSILSGKLIWTGSKYLLVGASNGPDQEMSVATLDRSGNVISAAKSLAAPGTAGTVNVSGIAIAD